jgi:PleD family two-component response regulator
MSFEKADFVVFSAQDKTEAIKIYFESGPFDIILFDMFLPNCKAYELVEELKRDYNFNEPFIFVSGEPSLDVVLEAIRSGPREYIMKPISNRELIQRIVKILEEKEKLNDNLSTMKTTVEKVRVLEKKYNRDLQDYISYYSQFSNQSSITLDSAFQQNTSELLEFLKAFSECLRKLK